MPLLLTKVFSISAILPVMIKSLSVLPFPSADKRMPARLTSGAKMLWMRRPLSAPPPTPAQIGLEKQG